MEYTVEPVRRQVGYLIRYKRNFENLKSKLENLDAAKDKMKHMVDEDERKGKMVYTDVQKWQTEANEMIQEANKLLDAEDYAKTKCFCGVCPNLVSYHQLSRKSAKLTKQIELIEKVEFPSVSYNAPLEEIFDTPSEYYMAFESRSSMVNDIMAELRNPDTNLIGVYGIGGVGKSTLVQEVYIQAQKEKLFDDVVLVLDVKQFPDAEKRERIQKKIAEKLYMDVQESQDMEARAKHLWNRIKDKKSLVILDDVWEAINLEDLGLRPMETCKILLTSRDLVSEMRTQKVFRLDVLGEKESWSLFEKMAGDVVKDDPIKKVATQVAKKCGGLPVLVVTVASALRLNSSLEVWKDTLRRFERFDNLELTKKACLATEWSYNRLDTEELQPLFLLCGVIAGDSGSILLSNLLKYAMGLGLIKNVDTVEEARYALHSLTRKLKDSFLLLDSDDDGVRMHELVQDVAMVIASRDNHAIAKAYGDELKEWPDRNSLKKCTTISLKSCKIPRLPEVPWVCPELRFFLLQNHNIDDSLEIPGNYFEGMKELKVLDVTRLQIPSLPPSLQSLTNLQTLCLDQCVLEDIALVGQLTNLKILSLLKSKVKELPKEIGQLTRLQLLDLTGCSELVLIPAGVISSLTRLEDLRMGSFKEWEGGLNDGRSNASVSELKQLRQLTALDIHIPDAKLLPANVFSGTRLERFTIVIGDCWPFPDIDETSSNMLKLKLTTNSQFDQGMKLLLKRCEDLELDETEAANIISYILASDSCKQLKKLHVQNNDEVTAVINSSHAFPRLESLSLDNLVNLETICCGQRISQPFQKLRSLTLRNLPKLIGFSSKGTGPAVTTEAEEIISENEIGGPTKLFMNGEVGFPSLESLMIDDMPKLRTIWHRQLGPDSFRKLKKVEVLRCHSLINIFPASMAKGLQQLRELIVWNCGILEEIVAKEGVETIPEFVFPKVTSLIFLNLPQLRSFYPGLHISKWPLLEELRFFECGKVEIFASEYSRFQERLDSGLVYTPIKQPFLLVDKVLMTNLTRLILHNRDGLRFLFASTRSVVQLEHIKISRCQIMKEVMLPNLTTLFEETKELKVLDITQLHVPSLPPSLPSLTNLQTLCFDQCVLGDIALVGELTNLKVLSLLNSQVKELPKEIGQLTSLQLLDLTGCSELVLISPGVLSSLTSLEDLRMGNFKQWEGEGSFGGRSNASVSELKQLRQLTALEMHIPDATLLPANMFLDTSLERYTIIIGDCWLFPDIYGTSSNKLKLKLTTKSQFDQGIKWLLKSCEHLSLDGMEATNIISYLLASKSAKQLKNLHVQNNDEVTAVIHSRLSSHDFSILESLSLRNLYVVANS